MGSLGQASYPEKLSQRAPGTSRASSLSKRGSEQLKKSPGSTSDLHVCACTHVCAHPLMCTHTDLRAHAHTHTTHTHKKNYSAKTLENLCLIAGLK